MGTRESHREQLLCKCGNRGVALYSEWDNPMHHGGDLGVRIEKIDGSFSGKVVGFNTVYTCGNCQGSSEGSNRTINLE